MSEAKREISIEYFAGFVDGEGHISIKQRNKTSNYVYALVMVVNTNIIVLEALKNKFGGILYKRKAKKGHKTTYCWEICSKASVPFLKAIYPHLVIKKKQASLALNLERILRKSGNKGLPKTLSGEEISIRKKLLRDIRLLNRRGSNGSS